MPKRSKGYISVRNCIDTKDSKVNDVVEKFTKLWDLCDACEGRTFTLNDSDVMVNLGVAAVKWKGNPLLEKLDEAGNLNGDTVKKIIETIVYGRKQCSKCNGFGFVKKSRKKDGNEDT